MNDWNAEQLKAWEALKIAAQKIDYQPWGREDERLLIEAISHYHDQEWDTLAELAADHAGLYPTWQYVNDTPVLCLNPAGLD